MSMGDLQEHSTAGPCLVFWPREILHDIYPKILRGSEGRGVLDFNKPKFLMKMEEDLLLAQSQMGELAGLGAGLREGSPASSLPCRRSAMKGTSTSSPCQELSEFPFPGQPVRTLKAFSEVEHRQSPHQFPWLCHSRV